MKNEDKYYEINLMQLLRVIWRRLWIILSAAILSAAGFFAWTYYMVTPLYESSILLYVNNSSFSLENTSFSISSSDLTAAKSLVDTYIVILNSRTTLNGVIKEASLRYSYEDLLKLISASAVNGTEIFQINVTDSDPVEAEKIANTIGIVLPEKISDIVEGSDVRIVDYAVVPAQRSSPSYTLNTAIGFLLGIVLSLFAVVIRQFLDTLVRTESHLTCMYDIPVLVSIPNMALPERTEV
jgi:Capsular polysaccharide biosynthesis protein